ncbi:VOC family protein [Paraburkholderia sp.]|uniref:VOC family protein n=1 Tax=Paraburkholderia sp. TaxID=1926495 RepID=UPI002385E09B|nr:VOC family protein [Paraburkholderia sp.]MDE1182838.1 VOC family protein [Paraburkholderia sp.]
MTAQSLRLDHLVISARTLDEGTQYVADTLGVAPSGGGSHPLMRTHNRLLNLWGGVYLEVIAIDPDAPDHADARPRLFALDAASTATRLKKGPYLSHWVARVDRPKSLARWQAQYPARIPAVVPMTRGAFTWSLTVADDGEFPSFDGAGDGILPSLIQWDTTAHPSAALDESPLALTSLSAVHPQASTIAAQLEWLGAAHLINVSRPEGRSRTATLTATFDTPTGPRTLS